MVDFVTRTDLDRLTLSNWYSDWNDITMVAGGTGWHVCSGVAESTEWQTILVSAIGGVRNSESTELVPDPLGQHILGTVEHERIDCAYELIEGRSTAKAFLIYPENGEGRLMFADTAILTELSSKHIADQLTRLDQATDKKAVYISGYLFFHTRMHGLLASAIQRLYQLHPDLVVWVDTVPHDLYRKLSIEDFIESVHPATCVSMDRETLEGFVQDSRLSLRSAIELLTGCGLELVLVSSDSADLWRDGIRVASANLGSASVLDAEPGLRDRLLARLIVADRHTFVSAI